MLKGKNASNLCTQYSNSCGNKAMCPELFIMALCAVMLMCYVYAFYRFQNTFIFFASPEYNNPHFKDKNTPGVREIQWFPQDHTARTGRAESFKSDHLVPGKNPFLLAYNSQKSQQTLWPLRRRWLHVPWPLGQGSRDQWHHLSHSTLANRNTLVFLRKMKRRKVEHNYIDDVTNVTIYVCTWYVDKWGKGPFNQSLPLPVSLWSL